MSNFEVLVEKILKVEDHPNADRLSIVTIRGYKCISAKLEDGTHRYKENDLVVYVPEDAIVPEWLLKRGFWDEEKNKGILSGTKGNRVKAIKLRGILSQGILFEVHDYLWDDIEFGRYVFEGIPIVYPLKINGNAINETCGDLIVMPGDNVAQALGITKYEPVIPMTMRGDVLYIGPHNTFKFDIENLKKYPDVFNDYDEVYITEKLHGTFAAFGYSDFEHEDLYEGRCWAASKGLGQQGLVFKDTEKNADSNLYMRIAKQLGIFDMLLNFSKANPHIKKLIVMGEIFGKGVQDLQYGFEKPVFRIFDIFYFDYFQNLKGIRWFIDSFGEGKLEQVPILYEGAYSRELIDKFTKGSTTFQGKNIREGIVIKLIEERIDAELGRIILKSISEDYLLRKDGTEYQ